MNVDIWIALAIFRYGWHDIVVPDACDTVDLEYSGRTRLRAAHLVFGTVDFGEDGPAPFKIPLARGR
jgi:hypothetical protein